MRPEEDLEAAEKAGPPPGSSETSNMGTPMTNLGPLEAGNAEQGGVLFQIKYCTVRPQGNGAERSKERPKSWKNVGRKVPL